MSSNQTSQKGAIQPVAKIDTLAWHDELVAKNNAIMEKLGPEAVALKLSLNAGDLIYCLEDAYFDYNEEVAAKKLISQRKGQIIKVNNPGWRLVDGERKWTNSTVGGNGVYDGPYGPPCGERSCVGLGCSFNDGTYRRALPTDEGYEATLDFWRAHDKELSIKEDVHAMNRELMLWMCIAVLVAVIILR